MSKPTEPQHRLSQFLHRACVELGFCLAPAVAKDLVTSSPSDASAFVAQVMLAEGLSPNDHPSHFDSLLALLFDCVEDSDFER